MAGRGFVPDPSKTSKTGHGQEKVRVLPLVRCPQPKLPTAPFESGWHPQTLVWWEKWGRSPLAADFTEADWDTLIDTAIVHSKHWMGYKDAAAELRLRMANYGVTPADRARLRIVWADADAKAGAEPKSGPQPSGQPTGGAYGSLKLAD